MTSVVNLRHCKDDDVVRIDRKSVFGNPYRIGQYVGEYNGNTVLSPVWQPWAPNKITREKSIDLYRKYFYDRLSWDKEFAERVAELQGYKLGCWCKPMACHGDIILEYLNGKD